MIYSTKKNYARSKLQDLPKDGATGEWHIMHSENGWMDRVVFLEMLRNFDQWLTNNNIQRPVILFIDGHKSHYGIAICEFCDEKQIKLFLFKPNCTDRCQPLDKVHYQLFKRVLSDFLSAWLAKNAGIKR